MLAKNYNQNPSISKRDLQRIPRVDIDTQPDIWKKYLRACLCTEPANPRERAISISLTPKEGFVMGKSQFLQSIKTNLIKKENNYV